MTTRPPIVKGRRTGLLARLIANGIVQAAIMVGTAVLVKAVFDHFMGPERASTTDLGLYAAGFAAAALMLAALRMLERVDAERLGQEYTHEVRVGLFQHLGELSPRLLQQRSRGGVLLRFVGDLTALKQWVSQGLARLTVAGVTTLGTVAALAFINVELALLVGTALTAGAIAVLALGGWLQKEVRDVRRRRARLAGNVNEKIAALGVIQVHGQLNRERRRVERQSGRLMTAMINRAKAVGAMRAVIELTTGLASAGALLLGAVLVGAGQATPGTVVAAMSVVGLLVPALRDLGRVQEFWQGALVAWEKIDDFLALPSQMKEVASAPRLAAGPGRLEFADVGVTGALHGFSAVAEAGQRIAIVGPNGAGKSTLLALAARLVAPDAGRVLLDGQDIGGLSVDSLRREVGVVSRDLPLLRGTVDRNLRYRWPEASDEAVARVRALCGIDELLAELPEGLESRVTEDGANLSLGQRQRLALARALLGDPRLLLLDEIDANLDPRAGAVLQRILREYPGTVVMASHRLDWVAMADRVWHVRNGVLLESGTPDSLLRGDTATARLFQRPSVVGS